MDVEMRTETSRGEIDRRDGAPALFLAFVVYLTTTAILIGVRTHISSWIPWGVIAITVTASSWDVAFGWSIYNGVMSAFFFDFFFAKPYGVLHFARAVDRYAAVALIVLSMIAALLGAAVRRSMMRSADDAETGADASD